MGAMMPLRCARPRLNLLWMCTGRTTPSTAASGRWGELTNSAAARSICAGSGRCTEWSGKPPKVHTNDHAPTLDEAKAQFEAAWKRWLDWAKLREM